MSEKPAAATAAVAAAAAPQQKLSESDDFTEDSADNTADAAREDTSQQSGLATVESEYDTASDSPSDGEEYDEQEEESGESGESGEEEEEELAESETEEGSDDDVIEVLDYERQSGDGQEQEADAAKRKVDDDEDRSNPQYIPKKGTFYEHDDRTMEDEDEGKEADDENVKNDEGGVGGGVGGGERKGGVEKSMASKTMKKWQASADRWTHDRFDESEQAPKSRAELVSAYGYDIRSEDGPPRARRRRRYARGPNKYTRNWEDEDAYSKSNNVNEHQRQRKSLPPRPEEFPELGNNGSASKTRSSQNLRRNSKPSRSSIGERLDERTGGGRPRSERRTSERNTRLSNSRVDHDRGMDRERERGGERYEQRAERNWDRERDYDQPPPPQQQHDGQYRDNRSDGSRYSADRMVNNNNSYHNKENKLVNRGSKEKDRRGSDYKVITSLQFKNQTRNKTNEGMPIAGPGAGGVAGGQVVHSNSGGALSGSSQSNKMNNAMDRVQTGGVQDRMLDQRPVPHHYPNQQAQLIQQQPPPQIPQQAQAPIQQGQAQPQQIPQQHHQQQQQQQPQQQAYVSDDHYDAYGDSKMPKDAKFPYNPPANATIQSVEIGQTDIAKYPPPQATQRPSKDRQQVLPATANVALNTRSQISPRQIVSTQASQLTPQQQQYQLQQAQYQQLHGPPTAGPAPPTQVPPPQLPQQQAQPPPAAQLHNVHMGAVNPQQQQQQMLPSDSSSRSSKRYSNLRQRSTLDNVPNVVAVQSPLHEQQQQQLLHQQQQQQLLLQQELHNQQQQQKLSSQTPKPGYPQQPTLPLNLPNEYPTKPQPATQPPVQYQHAAAAYYNPNTPAGTDFVTATTSQPVPVVPQQPTVPVVNQQPPNPLLTAPQYQYIQAPPPAAYIPQTTAVPQPTSAPATAAPPPQILNYVPTITPPAPTQYPAASYTGYQNYNAVVPQPVAPAVPINPAPSAATAALYQSSGGITYYAPQSQTQAPRPLPSQRRPTAAIPILAPPDRKAKNNRSGVDPSGGATSGNDGDESQAAPAASAADNIDHILDNMFVQRPPYQPPARKSPSPAPAQGGNGGGGEKADGGGGGKDGDKEAVDKMGEAVKNLTIQEENRPVIDAMTAGGSSGAEKLDLAATAPSVDPTAG